jgi:hypothetical protein
MLTYRDGSGDRRGGSAAADAVGKERRSVDAGEERRGSDK